MADRQPDQMGVCAIVPSDRDRGKLRVFGMGILVADRAVVTCAHVVNIALDRHPATQEDAKGFKLQVWFPFEGGDACIHGKVERWFPVGERPRGEPTDVSVILLDEDAPQSVCRAVFKPYQITRPQGAFPTTFGYQCRTADNGSVRSHPTGERPTGRIIGSIPDGLGQFDGFPVTGAAVQRGFSGSGIYDPDQDAIVGMVQKGDQDATKRIALFLTTPSLEKALEGILTSPTVPSSQTGQRARASAQRWWIYGLVGTKQKTNLFSVGYYKLRQTSPHDAVIESGRVFRFDRDMRQIGMPRGEWKSHQFLIGSDKINVFYTMDRRGILRRSKQDGPAEYESVLQLHRDTTRPIVGDERWAGSFHDLQERRQVNGIILAERLSEEIDGLEAAAQKMRENGAKFIDALLDKFVSL